MVVQCLNACDEREVPEQRAQLRPEPQGAQPAPAARLPPTQVRRGRRVMSTSFDLSIVLPEASPVERTRDEANALRAAELALDEVARLETILSEWRADSPVSRINQNAGIAPVQVPSELMQNLETSLEIAARSEGAYDITWAALREFYLFQRNAQTVPDMAAVRRRLPLVNWRELIVDHDANTAFLRRPGMAIGLGGIAKGYAADAASAVLTREGFPNHMVFAGGQVLVHGDRGDRPWRVGVQHPRTDQHFGFLELEDASIGTAGDYEHAIVAPDGTRWHHIIDLHTGLPSTASASVTIVAPTGLLADGLDTACFILGAARCARMLSEHYPEVGAVIVSPDLHLTVTSNLTNRFTLVQTLDDDGRLPPGP